MAIAGRVRVFKDTWPWGSEKKDEIEDLLNEPGNPEQAMRDLIALASRRKDQDRRRKPKTKK